MPSMLRALTGALFVLCLLPVRAEPPPPAPSEPVVDTLHGVRVEDPFRNLENLRGPATRAWLEAQAAYGERTLAQIDGREALSQRIAELAASGGDSVRSVRRFAGGRVY